MSEQLRKYKLFDGAVKKSLVLVGIWPIPNASVAYRLLAFVHGLPLVIEAMAMSNFCYHNLTNLPLLVRGLVLTCSLLTAVTKIICLTAYRKRLVKLHNILAKTFSQDFEDSNLQPVLLSPLTKFYNTAYAVTALSYFAWTIYTVSPLFIMASQFHDNVDHIRLLLPYPARYPWHTTGNIWIYLSHYVFEFYAGACLTVYSTAIDALCGYYAFQIAGQLRTLSSRLSSVTSTENYQRVIRECVTRHAILIKCQRNLQIIFGPIIVWLMVSSSVAICAQIYVIASQGSRVSVGKSILAVVYIFLKSFQIYLYGSFGTFLTNENENFRNAVYSADWAGCGDRRLMTDILIIISYEPFALKACSLTIISVNMFVTAINTSLSYFFMIRTLEEGNES